MTREANKDTQYSSIAKKGGGAGRKWMFVSLLLGAIALGLLIALVVVITKLGKLPAAPESPPNSSAEGQVDASESPNPGVFHDLTRSELLSLQEYLYSDKASDLNLVRPDKAALNVSYVFITDLLPPNKTDVLGHLDDNGPTPVRRARVVVFRGDKTPPVVEEYIVQPIPNPTRHDLFNLRTRRNPIPFAYRPIGRVELAELYESLWTGLQEDIGDILKESYDAGIGECGDKCLTYYPHPMSSAIVGADTRKMWFEINYYVPYYGLHPTGFLFLGQIDGSDKSKFSIEKVIYGGESFNSVQEFKTAYTTGAVTKIKLEFPKVVKNLFSTLDYRGDAKPSKRAPQLVEPDGKRYTLNHRQVKYMDWQFDFRMSALTGPQLYNIMYGKDRIAYEVGLQEIAVFYSGANPAARLTDFVDSGVLLGTHAKSLVPGGDCPETATFIPATFLSELTEEPQTVQRSFCLFEQNTGVPLRRHLSYAVSEGAFYGGVMDNVLILRTILTVVNYDYIFDFIFHQNGAMEVRAVSTGYIYTTFYNQAEDKYGFRLNENILANLHHHMFHFKVDLDVLGTSNRYETLDIETEDLDISGETGTPGDKYNQIFYTKNLKNTETEAAYKFNFDTPKYHIIHNNAEKTSFGVPKAYRIQMNGMSKQTLKKDSGNEATVSWSRYQMAVTKYKHDEFGSSSPYKMFDGRSPVVNFQEYIDDNDNIVDEDLVLWLAMGVHHIPHTEDLPITPTPGAHLSFALLPYNYFKEDPSMTSPDSITIAHKDPTNPQNGVLFRRYHNATGRPTNVNLPSDNLSDYEDNPDLVLQSRKKFGLL
ncbi:putative amine oxidase [copper-containing] [Patella vulgata]|uniref:putative amine oxidase [copper-containing] n=1 Tax=Patella vulgata TaxID=6465 RepID=UPI00217F6F42|nr:putative amine oxidase [copper-containing] [Patella vulgata]